MGSIELLTIKVAAKEIHVPAAALERAARKHGFLLDIGGSIRIERSSLKDLLNACRVKPKEHDSTIARQKAAAKPSTSSAMGNMNSRPAQRIANTLKQRSATI